MYRALQTAMLGAYRVVFAKGLLRFGWGRRLFFAVYELYKNLFEAGPIEGLRAYLPAGGFAIDVGANVGFFTERFARWAGPEGRVIAIEPESANFAELTRRLARKGFEPRVDLRQAVADQRAGTARLSINPDHPGDHRIGDVGAAVAAVTLDGIVPLGRTVSLIKIDVQGAELRVLAGAARLLAEQRPALFIEIHPPSLALFGATVDDLFGFLVRHDYAPHLVRRSGARPCSRAELDALVARRGYADLLFLAPRLSAEPRQG